MNRIAQIEKRYAKADIPRFKSGDTLRVHVKIKEGDKERIQVFQGTVIGRRGSGTGATFTVRKTSSGIGVERVFPMWSPNIDRIEKIRAGKVRRKKLYYLRELTGKSARIKEQLSDSNNEKEPVPEVEAFAEAEAEPAAEAAAEAPETEAEGSSDKEKAE